MSDATAQNTPNSSRRSRTPDEANTEVRKRRRIALSCYDCRRRKLRCDREYPACGRCRKGGHPDTCSYDSRVEPPAAARNGRPPVTESDDDRAAVLSPTSSNTVPRPPAGTEANQHAPRGDGADLLAFQRRKISELESRLAQLEGKTKDSNHNGRAIQHAGDEVLWPNSALANRRPIGDGDEGETMLLRGKAFKTAYFGRSNITSVVVTHVSALPSMTACLLPVGRRCKNTASLSQHRTSSETDESSTFAEEFFPGASRLERSSSNLCSFRACALSCKPHSNSFPTWCRHDRS